MTTAEMFNDAPLAREAVLLAERELAQTIRALDKRATKVTATDMRRLLAQPEYRGLRLYTGLAPDDRVSRCGCGEWCINPDDHGGRADVPKPWAGKVKGHRPTCQACAVKAARAAKVPAAAV